MSFDAGAVFLDRSRRYLQDDYLPRLRVCLRTLSPEDLWWRPHEGANSAGNLVLHLAGNVRQWIVSGLGGAPDVRQRPVEFAARTGPAGAEALARLEATVAEAAAVLRDFPPGRLGERRMIQGHDVTALDVVYHVVEHFGMHTGQVVYLTKLRTGRDLGFYRIEGDRAIPQWQELDREGADR